MQRRAAQLMFSGRQMGRGFKAFLSEDRWAGWTFHQMAIFWEWSKTIP
jgi:hypothetical protein